MVSSTDTKIQRGERLRGLLDERWGGKDAEFAERVGVTPTTLWRLTKGKSDLARSPNLLRIAEELGVTPDYLLGREAAVRERGPRYVVPIDESGEPLQDELEELRSWLPDEAQRRMSRHVTERVWLGTLYSYATDQGWPAERVDRIDAARRRVDASRQAEDSG